MPERPRHRVAAAALAALAAVPGGAAAAPLFDQDNGPLSALFGWHNATEGARLAAPGESRWSLHVATASHSVSETAGGESLLLDGETTRVWLDWRRGFSDRLEIGALLPWVWHESGGLDSLISGWHDFFGLPEGNRPSWPEDRLLFEYLNGDEALRLRHNGNGPGDLRLYGGWRLTDGLALRAGIKLPTGDSAGLRGSGAADLSLGLAADASGLWDVEGLDGFFRLTALYLGATDFAPMENRRLAGQLAAGLDYALTPAVSLTAQSAVRSSAWDSRLAAVGDWAMSLSAGAGFRLPGGFRLSLAVTEDVKVESFPDVTFVMTIDVPAR